MTRLLLVRHGETDWNREGRIQGHTDRPLNETGRRQAERLARRLAGWPIAGLYSSDLARAAESARIVGRAIGREPVLDPDWRERSGGEVEGLVEADIRARYPEVWSEMRARRFWTAPRAETVEAVRERIVAAYHRVVERHPGETVAVVSHGFALRLLVAHVIGLPLDRPTAFSVGGNTGLTRVEVDERGAVVTLLNDTSHLETDLIDQEVLG